ncbi:MAG: guanylate kinase [Patescibacteria group bacterium]
MIGKLFLIVGPSGVGKGTLINELRARHPEFYFPISVTTRPIRKNEKAGEQYFFVSDDEFAELKQENKFLETALVHATEKYGTLREPIEEAIHAGQTVIREVDIQGLRSIQNALDQKHLVSIFLAPPSFEILTKRIHKRQPNMSAEELNRRLASAKKELAHKNLADFEVISEEGAIDKMVAAVEKIIADATKN